MSTLYIDYTHSVPVGMNKVHGGAVYTRTLLINLKNHLQANGIHDKKIVLLWPEGYDPDSIVENEIYHYPGFEIQRVSGKLDAVSYEPDAVVYIPLLAVKEYGLLKRLHNKGIKVIMTIHGLRVLDFRYDSYNLKYVIGWKDRFISWLMEVSLPLKHFLYVHSIRKYTPSIDVLITVSNFTLAGLARYARINQVVLQYEDTLQVGEQDEGVLTDHSRNYMLFVSGNRTEKNLARTIDAYRRYREQGGDVDLFVVGTSQKIRAALIKNLDVADYVNEKKIVFFDYVTDEELAALYANARFLVYTSKSEGFGLPALEAARHGCPVVAAYGTSIPEVLGGNCFYVNPYSLESICHGMRYLSDENNRIYYKRQAESAYRNNLIRIADSNETVIRTLLSDD